MLNFSRLTLTTAREALALTGELAALLAMVATCRVRGHAALDWHEFANGNAVGVCSRCAGTVVPMARVWP